ncbi:MAG TPA: isoprenylcysteine carboxylmethyltransferase family protein [Baekduia sp.]
MRGSRRRALVLGNLLFFLAGTCLEAGVGPWLLVQVAGRDAGDVTGGPRVLGAVLIACSLGVLLDVYVRFVRDGLGTPSPAAPARFVISGGVYGYIRHPMYAATASIIFGEALLFGQPILFLAAAAYVVTTAALAHFVEEPRLARRFGASYDAYRRAVPGWVPRPGRR